ncbi:MAG: amidohydrolase [Desulfosarcina sp.]|nr:amidohydrolase [Desulfobacterales bacterium]
MSHLKVTLVQANLAWEDPDANRAYFDNVLASAEGAADLVVLPEMFTTGFTMNAGPLAESMRGPTLGWMTEMARRLAADVTGSVIIREDGRLYNRLLWVKPDGQFYAYDKRHLFRMSGEHKVYAAGRELLTVTIKGWRVRPFICYDLRFPVWCRNRNNAYDLAIYVANWPSARALHWRALLKARAIENQCCVVGVNRVGTDGNGLAYRGDSTVIDPQGAVLYHCEDREDIFTTTLSHHDLEACREAFPVWKDADTYGSRKKLLI